MAKGYSTYTSNRKRQEDHIRKEFRDAKADGNYALAFNIFEANVDLFTVLEVLVFASGLNNENGPR